MDLEFVCSPHDTAMYSCTYSSKAEAPNSQVTQKQVLKMLPEKEAAGLYEMTRKTFYATMCIFVSREVLRIRIRIPFLLLIQSQIL